MESGSAGIEVSSGDIDEVENRFSRYVEDAFERASPEFTDAFLSELRNNWRDALARSRRLVFLAVLLVVLFTLLAGADVSEIAFAGIELTPSSVDAIAIGIPALIAFVFAQYWELYALMDQYWGLHAEICRQVHPKLGPLERVLHPPETNHPGSFDVMVLGRGGTGEGVLKATSIANGLMILVAPFAVGGLYVLLLTLDFDVNPIAYVVSLLIGAFSLIRVIGLFMVR